VRLPKDGSSRSQQNADTSTPHSMVTPPSVDTADERQCVEGGQGKDGGSHVSEML
jgi:hypothetical protein